MEHASLGVVLVTALEIVLRVHGHIARRYVDVLVVRDVHACRIVHLVIGSRSNGEARHSALAMIEHGIHVGWEHALVGIVHLYRRIRPPQEGLRQVRAVRHPTLNLQIGTSGAQRKARHSLLMEHPLHLVDPYCHGAILILHDGGVHRQISAGAVVLGPVELNAARNPGSGKTDQGRLDDVVVIHEVTLLDFVIRHLDTAAQLRQYHHLDILILEIDGLPLLVGLLVADGLDDGVGVDHSA